LTHQLSTLDSDFTISAIKTGMIANPQQVAVIADYIRNHPNQPPLVVDPVYSATGGQALANDSTSFAIQELLFPLATVITPHLPEAAHFAGCDPTNLEALSDWAQSLDCATLLKGGHGSQSPLIDRLFVQGKMARWTHPRQAGPPIRGTGCALASSIAGYLALGEPLTDAVDHAIAKVQHKIQSSHLLPGGTHERTLIRRGRPDRT